MIMYDKHYIDVIISILKFLIVEYLFLLIPSNELGLYKYI